jgi:hypothetical protein
MLDTIANQNAPQIPNLMVLKEWYAQQDIIALKAQKNQFHAPLEHIEALLEVCSYQIVLLAQQEKYAILELLLPQELIVQRASIALQVHQLMKQITALMELNVHQIQLIILFALMEHTNLFPSKQIACLVWQGFIVATIMI